MDRTELAWAAGFFDGEGWAALTQPAGRNTGQPRAQINQSSSEGIPVVLERFRRAVRVGVVDGPALEERKLPRYWWVVSSREDVTTTYHTLRPWLADLKQREFIDALGAREAPRTPSIFDPAERLAWASGFFDGEGSVYLAKHRTHTGYFRLESAVTQSSSEGIPAILQLFNEIVGIGLIRGPYPSLPGHQPPYRWKAHRRADIETMIEQMRPWLGAVKIAQAETAMRVVAAQAPLPRGNPAWGNRKTHCVNGHEYATARMRAFRGRGKNTEPPRASHQCLACVRDYARKKREERKQESRGLHPRLS